MNHTSIAVLVIAMACSSSSDTSESAATTTGDEAPREESVADTSATQTADEAVPPGTMVSDEGVGAQGYDVVAYHDGAAQQGDPALSADHRGVRYHFANAENLARFAASPDEFLPEFGGWCAFAVAEHQAKVPPNPETFSVQDGRLLLFFNGPFEGQVVDTSQIWSQNPSERLVQADTNWPAVENQ